MNKNTQRFFQLALSSENISPNLPTNEKLFPPSAGVFPFERLFFHVKEFPVCGEIENFRQALPRFGEIEFFKKVFPVCGKIENFRKTFPGCGEIDFYKKVFPVCGKIENFKKTFPKCGD